MPRTAASQKSFIANMSVLCRLFLLRKIVTGFVNNLPSSVVFHVVFFEMAMLIIFSEIVLSDSRQTSGILNFYLNESKRERSLRQKQMIRFVLRFILQFFMSIVQAYNFSDFSFSHHIWSSASRLFYFSQSSF